MTVWSHGNDRELLATEYSAKTTRLQRYGMSPTRELRHCTATVTLCTRRTINHPAHLRSYEIKRLCMPHDYVSWRTIRADRRP